MAELKIETLNHTVPNAYHGTNRTNAEKIEAQGFEVGRNPYYYLGDGVYFYEGSMMLARNHVVKRRGFKAYGILQATVQLGKCLDLNTPEHCAIMKTVREVIIENTEEDPKKITDAFIINWYACHYETELETIKWTLHKTKWNKIFPESRVRYSEPMICVRNVDNISDVRIVEVKPR